MIKTNGRDRHDGSFKNMSGHDHIRTTDAYKYPYGQLHSLQSVDAITAYC